MSDGRIVIDIEANASSLADARKKIQEVEADVIKATDPPKVSDPFETLGDSATKAKPKISDLAKSIGLAQLGLKALNVVIGSIGGAVKRFDTMNQFPRMMEQLGYSAEESEESINTLVAGIDGLPTALDDVVSTTQQLTLITKDLGESTKLTIALNNAFLASGSSGADAARGLQQYTQMLAKGKVDQQSWNTLIETMPLALDTVAQSLLGANANQADLYAALQDGTITFDEFNQALITANEGVGGFAEMALTGSEGIATSWQNIQTAVTRGVANVITALDDMIEAATGKNIAQHFNGFKDIISRAFNAIVAVIKSSTPVIKIAFTAIDGIVKVLEFLSPLIYGVAAAWGTLMVFQKVAQWFEGINTVVKTLQTTKAAYIGITKLLAATEVEATGVQKVAALMYAFLTDSVARANIMKQAGIVITKAYNTVLTAMSGPIGWIIAGIGLVVAGFVIFNQTLGKASEEALAMADDMGKAAEASEDLATKVEDSAEAYDKHIESINNNEEANLSLVESLETLMKKEEKTKADKEMIKKYVDELNGSVEGLNLTYNEERDALNESSEAMRTRIKVMSDQERANASLERLIEIEREQIEVTTQLETNQRLLAEAEKERNETSWLQVGTHTALNTSITELEEKNAELLETQNALGVEMTVVEEAYLAQIESMDSGISTLENTILSYDTLNEKQREVIDSLRSKLQEYETTATDVFTKVETVIKGTTEDGEEYVKSSTEVVGDMIETLQHNQETLQTLGENIGGLRTQFEELGLDQAILDYFVDLGPEAAPYIQALADVSDEELAAVATTFAEGGETAVTALFEALGIDPADYPDNFTSMITDMEKSLSEQIEEADFNSVGEELGSNLVEGTVAGVTDNAEDLNTAASDLATGAEDAFKSEAGIESPSTVFNTLASFLVAGAVNGINENARKLSDAVTKLAKGGVKAFNDVVPEFKTAGQNAGRGFNDGLASMRSEIMATARDIASSAARAINKELVIKSPSRVTFRSGADTGEGFELGLLDKLEDVEKAGLRLAQASLPHLDLGQQYTRNYMRQSVQNVSHNTYSSSAYDKQTALLTKQNDYMIGVLKDIADIEERNLQKSPILQAFFDNREVTKELDGPMNDYRKINDERKTMLEGTWI